MNNLNAVFYTSIILFIFTYGAGLSQDIPNYPERLIGENFDSLKNLQPDASIVSATGGIIDAKEYVVGPGDKLFISISGVKEVIHSLIIDQEGFLYIPRLGGIDLRNISLADAKQKISERLNEYYKNVEIFISLVDFRKIIVSLTGNVVKPHTTTVSANSRLMDLISSSSVLTLNSDIRNIKIVSKYNGQNIYDLLSFLRTGNYDNNPYLEEGDVVIIDKIDKLVKISGSVMYPAIYEYVPGEGINDLIKLAGGFLSTAKTDTIEVVSYTTDGKSQTSNYFSMNEIEQNSILLKNGDHIIVRQIPDYLIEHSVLVEGFVTYPGWYKIVKDKTTLKDIIGEAGGFLNEASLTEATVTRKMQVDEKDPEYERLRLISRADMTENEYDYFKAKSRQTSGRVIVDFVDLFVNSNQDENIILIRGDIIKIPEKKNYVIMLGQLIMPGKVIYDSTLSVNDYINLAGGFGWRAIEDEVRVIKANTGEWLDAKDILKLDPGDTIWVPEDPPGPKFWEVFMDGLTIVAQLAAVAAAMAAIIIATR
jgi:protein involved in polysaccharide export with SLBB domain